MVLDELDTPIVLAPMAGGPSTPELAAAVTEAGGLGFVAAGYLPASELAARIKATRALTSGAFGVNLFYPSEPSPTDRFDTYIRTLAAEFPVGEARYDSDDWAAKLDLLIADPVPVVSSTFGCPSAGEIARLHAAGSEVWVTVTTAAEARQAVAAGADVLIAQGAEAGGHRGVFVDDPADDLTDPLGLLTLLQLLRAEMAALGNDTPIVAAGGIATGAAVAGVLCAGAAAAQLGTAFLRCPEAGTAPVVRDAIAEPTPTMLTRAFTGRRARGLRNRFMVEHPDAPVAYPEIHYATGPLRAAARAAGNADEVNLWAGQAHSLAPELPAGELVRTLSADAKNALERVLSLRIQSY